MAVQVEKVIDQRLMKTVFAIRREVFVIEQHVAPEEEFDTFEEVSTHFLATLDGTPCGTARWRETGKGIKLERFAVLESVRGKGVGSALVEAVLDNIHNEIKVGNVYLYMHAQLDAIPLYKKFGFQTVGDEFLECNIRHYKMELQLDREEG